MNKFQTRRDLMLMTCLRSNARENLTTISRLTKIPVSTIFDKLREFEKGLIRKHTTLIDFKKLGFDIKVNMLFKVSKENKDTFKEYLVTNINVNSVFRVNNGFDYLIEAIFKDMNALHDFREDIERFGVENIQEMFILEDLKREGFLADRLHTELLFAGQ